MKAKEFEEACIAAMKPETARGRATMVRYGVQASFRRGFAVNVAEYVTRLRRGEDAYKVLAELIKDVQLSQDGWRPQQSLPDFTGAIARRGQAFDFDAKVCTSAASFVIDDSRFKDRQLRYLLERSRFGVVTFLLIYFGERVLVKKTVPAETFAFPVAFGHPFWDQFARGEVKSITRDHCREHGVQVIWSTPPRGTKPRMELLEAILQLSEMFTSVTI